MKINVLKISISMFVFLLIIEMFTLKFYAEDKKVRIDGNNRVIGVPQTKINNTVYVSVIPALELIGWKSEENRAKNEISFKKDNSTLFIKVDASEIILDGEKLLLDKPIEMVNDEIYLPSKFVAEKFGVQIRWNNKDNLIILSGFDEKSVYVEGEGNIIIAGNGVIINIFEAYTKATIYDMLSYADRLLGKNKLEEAVLQYKEILRNIDPDENKELYVHVLINMGNAYSLLSERKDPCRNAKTAIEHYEKALAANTEGKLVDSRISVLNNLGKLYRVLFEFTEDKTKLAKSLEILTEASSESHEEALMERALICYNLGLAQKALDMKEVALNNFIASISLYSEAIKVHKREKNPDTFALLKYNIGNCCSLLGEIQGDEKSFDDSKAAYEEALEVWSIESFPENYARVHKCLGELYRKKYILDGKLESLKSALAMYKESFLLFSRNKFEWDYAKVNMEMGEIYLKLSFKENYRENIYSSVICFNKALIVFNSTEYVFYYESLLLKLAEAYSYFMLGLSIL